MSKRDLICLFSCEVEWLPLINRIALNFCNSIELEAHFLTESANKDTVCFIKASRHS